MAHPAQARLEDGFQDPGFAGTFADLALDQIGKQGPEIPTCRASRKLEIPG